MSSRRMTRVVLLRSRPARSRQKAAARRCSGGFTPPSRGVNPRLQSAAKSSYSIRRKLGSRNHHERAAGGRSSLRSPDAPLESENEGIHFRRAQRHSHHRSAENPQDVSRSEPLRKRNFRARQKRSFR